MGQSPKIGLALSGGGFRAAFFHVGVLARLAELGILPKVEVISTVSGGSIVGALYYLRLKVLLEEKPAEEIDKGDYIELVADVERRLLAGVQENIRARAFTNAFKNLEMFRFRYSRSDRIGDLYDRCFYKDAWGENPGKRSLGRDKQIEVRNLPIHPEGTTDFTPESGNAGREVKVPALLINATSLNSGHNWRFEAVRMGEPLPEDTAHARIVDEVDKSMRLEQGYFKPRDGQPTVPESQVDFPLGLAVAASAGVPGVFQPLAISKMYDGIRVQLVDGGVQDNQGIQGLFDRDCKQLIVSDASGQLDDKKEPSPLSFFVLKRSASIGQNRIRSEQLIDAEAIETYDYALMHLRKGLPDKKVAPGDSLEKAIEEGKRNRAKTADFGVDLDVQAALSSIRTDLDYFGRTEAHSLELDAYLMSKHELEEADFNRLGDGEERLGRWAFDGMKGEIGEAQEPYLATLRAGKKGFFRLLALRPSVAIPYGILAVALFSAIAYAVLCLTLQAVDDSPWWCVVLALVAAAVVLAQLILFLFSNLSVLKAKLLYPK